MDIQITKGLTTYVWRNKFKQRVRRSARPVFDENRMNCKSAEEICKLAEKEEAAYKTISEKNDAANEAIKVYRKILLKLKKSLKFQRTKV